MKRLRTWPNTRSGYTVGTATGRSLAAAGDGFKRDCRERVPRTEFGKLPPITIVRYRCKPCGVSWQIFPLFLARYLWRTWDVVERTLMPEPSPREPEAKPEPKPEPKPEAKAREPRRKMAKRTV